PPVPGGAHAPEHAAAAARAAGARDRPADGGDRSRQVRPHAGVAGGRRDAHGERGAQRRPLRRDDRGTAPRPPAPPDRSGGGPGSAPLGAPPALSPGTAPTPGRRQRPGKRWATGGRPAPSLRAAGGAAPGRHGPGVPGAVHDLSGSRPRRQPARPAPDRSPDRPGRGYRSPGG